MSIHIIIDGYNLIRQSNRLSILDLQDIQLGRDALVDMLAAYNQKKGAPQANVQAAAQKQRENS